MGLAGAGVGDTETEEDMLRNKGSAEISTVTEIRWMDTSESCVRVGNNFSLGEGPRVEGRTQRRKTSYFSCFFSVYFLSFFIVL